MSLLWSVAALGLALALTPLYVSLCHSLTQVSARNAHRLVATQRGLAELERLRAGAGAGEFAVPELPSGRGAVALRNTPGGVREAVVILTWDESGHPARAEWTTLLPARPEGGRR
ncbi:MAG TPA: hypothetical protein VFU47_10485 [Armatimonadota bacterium]|nr:hypothetical protein [Armatimonadota bacterium]